MQRQRRRSSSGERRHSGPCGIVSRAIFQPGAPRCLAVCQSRAQQSQRPPVTGRRARRVRRGGAASIRALLDDPGHSLSRRSCIRSLSGRSRSVVVRPWASVGLRVPDAPLARRRPRRTHSRRRLAKSSLPELRARAVAPLAAVTHAGADARGQRSRSPLQQAAPRVSCLAHARRTPGGESSCIHACCCRSTRLPRGGGLMHCYRVQWVWKSFQAQPQVAAAPCCRSFHEAQQRSAARICRCVCDPPWIRFGAWATAMRKGAGAAAARACAPTRAHTALAAGRHAVKR